MSLISVSAGETRAAERKEARRQQILDGALAVFAEKGYHSAGIQDIAARLGLGHGTFYRYFKNKLDIFQSLLDQMIEKIQVVLATEDPAAPNDVEEYRAQTFRLAAALAQALLVNRDLTRIFLREAVGLNDEVDAQVDRAMELLATFTSAFIRNGVEKGFLRRVDVATTARCVNGMIFEAAREALKRPDSTNLALWAQTITTLMFDGLAKPAA